jgi:adenylate cyclase
VNRSQALDRRLAAVWFADIVGYTRLAVEDEDAALGAVERFQKAIREVVGAHRGRLVKFIGDAAMVEFPSAGGAVSAALDLAKAFAPRLDSTGGPPVIARVGIHVGEVAATPDGDLLGDDVNLASRIHTAAEPGQVVVSEDVARQLRHLRDVRFDPLGEREFKGVPELTRVFAVRFATDSDVAPVAVAPPRSIAVLPFANLSSDPANEYFSDGVMEEILTSLAQIEGLKVISRTSAMRYKGSQRSLRQIGEELGVATILEGSVRRAGDRVRITTQLIDARNDEHLWASRYDRELEDIFAIQTDVAERIVGALRVRLKPAERERLSSPKTRDLQAYQHYLLGVHFWNRRERAAFLRAIKEYESAIDLDPEFAQAWSGLAAVHAFSPEWEPNKAAEKLRRAVEAVERALELEPRLGEAYAVLAEIRLREWKWEEADGSFRRAIEFSPSNATSHQWYAHYLASMGRMDEAVREIDRALELDPLSLPVQTEAGNIMLYARRYDEAVLRYRDAIDLDSSFLIVLFRLADVYRFMGRHEEAVSQWQRLGILNGNGGVRPADGQAEDSDRPMEAALAMAKRIGSPPVFLASMCAVAGRIDEAFEYLEHGLAIRDWTLVSLAANPLFDSLRADPRYTDILGRCGLG